MSKLTIELNDRMSQVLGDVASREGVSKVELLRRALALYGYAQNETDESDRKRLSITQDGKILRDIVLTK